MKGISINILFVLYSAWIFFFEIMCMSLFEANSKWILFFCDVENLFFVTGFFAQSFETLIEQTANHLSMSPGNSFFYDMVVHNFSDQLHNSLQCSFGAHTVQDLWSHTHV